MQRISPSIRVYAVLIIILAVLGAVNTFLPQGAFAVTPPDQQLPASKPILALATAGILLIVYGGLGFLGLRIASGLGFPDIWDPAVSNVQRFAIPALVGAGVGVFFIIADALFQRWHSLGALPHPPFPTSLVASATAGIGEEVIFRLFFIPFWMWLISSVLLRGRGREATFWVVALASALAFALGHLPSAMLILGFETIQQIPIALLFEIVLLNGVVSLFAAYYFRRYGFLAAVVIHFWTDIVWHVIWGLAA